MPFRIGIVGAGWYGCHLAASLISLGFSVRIFDRQEQLMRAASGNNQFRLHQGFHYARNKDTRLQSRDGFQRFIERYPTLSLEVPENIYAVPKRKSLLDFSTYKLIMAASGIDYLELQNPHPLLADVEGCLQTGERVIMLDRARRLFEEMLQGALELGQPVKLITQDERCATLNGERFDYVIDATWGQLRPLPVEVYYEPTLLLYYESQGIQPAITFVDGSLSSIYPTEDPAIFTLSSVPHTPLGHYATAKEAHSLLRQVDRSLVERKRAAMEAQICENVPVFQDLFRCVGAQFAIKTKPVGQSDDRSCCVFREGRIFTVMSGKIDTIFFATERILSMIEGDHMPVRADNKPSTLRDSIILPMN